MAGKMARQKKEAARVARYLGHELSEWDHYNKFKATAQCHKCRDFVVVDLRPLYDPKGKVWGTAVTYFCGEKKLRDRLKDLQECLDEESRDAMTPLEVQALEDEAGQAAKELEKIRGMRIKTIQESING